MLGGCDRSEYEERAEDEMHSLVELGREPGGRVWLVEGPDRLKLGCSRCCRLCRCCNKTSI